MIRSKKRNLKQEILMQPFLCGAGITTLYIIVAVGIMLLLRKFLTIPDEIFRKTLHFILLGAYIPLVFAFEAWWMAAIFALALIVILFPALYFAQRIPMFSAFMNERKKESSRAVWFWPLA